jgi:hypothetical protein
VFAVQLVSPAAMSAAKTPLRTSLKRPNDFPVVPRAPKTPKISQPEDMVVFDPAIWYTPKDNKYL